MLEMGKKTGSMLSIIRLFTICHLFYLLVPVLLQLLQVA